MKRQGLAVWLLVCVGLLSIGAMAKGGAGFQTGVGISGIYNSSPPTFVSGSRADLQTDVNGRLLVSSSVTNSGTFAVQQTPFTLLDAQFGAAISHASKASAGSLAAISIASTDSNLVYLQVFNTTSVPGNGATPLMSWPVGPGGPTTPTYLTVGPSTLGTGGIAMSTGISWGISSTNSTYTATADLAANFNVTVIGS